HSILIYFSMILRQPRSTLFPYTTLFRSAKIALIARSAEQLEATKKEVEGYGGTAIMIETDVADANQVEAAAERTEREFGEIDIWINNAMNSVFSPIHKITPEEFKRVTEVTYLGTVYGAMSAL